MSYITRDDIEARLGPQIVQEILDDNVDASPDKSAVDRVIADAESYVEGFLRGIYDIDALRALGTGAPNEVKRLCLDVATAYLWERHPEYVRADGNRLLARVRQELIDLRRGKTRLDVVDAPEPAANQGGEIRSGDPDDPNPVGPIYNRPDSFGIY